MPRGFPVARNLLVAHAVTTAPAQRLGLEVAHSTHSYQPSPKGLLGRLRIVLFEACSAFTRVTACTLTLSSYIVTR